ncbi:hypothetical protein [Lysinibacter cavernae]|uniref:Uncharacterized protein n=1 Tax=Lysinibacter cavernae TaxID=1640652 RepID=A0A7X5TU08_9MICO|nr:hypothetical protein [Lysinibacter cavernae]NIH54760.1 hypothetical protein [Lysinibacter cavernae]
MTSTSSGQPVSELTRPARPIAFGVVVMVIGILLAWWMTAGRALFGVSGDMVTWFAFTLGPVVAAIQIMTGIAIIRTARLGFHLRRSTVVCLSITWAVGLLFGLTVPDTTADGLESAFSTFGGPVALEIGIGFSNPLGVITVAMAIFALVFSIRDSRGPRPVDDED